MAGFGKLACCLAIALAESPPLPLSIFTAAFSAILAVSITSSVPNVVMLSGAVAISTFFS